MKPAPRPDSLYFYGPLLGCTLRGGKLCFFNLFTCSSAKMYPPEANVMFFLTVCMHLCWNVPSGGKRHILFYFSNFSSAGMYPPGANITVFFDVFECSSAGIDPPRAKVVFLKFFECSSSGMYPQGQQLCFFKTFLQVPLVSVLFQIHS